MNTYVNLKQINEVVEKTVQAIEEGKNDLFEISEKARNDCRTLEQELVVIHGQIQKAIEEVDSLELKEKLGRVKLLNVSKNFNDFSEADIKQAYDTAKDLQILLTLKRQEEKALFKERSRLEIRLKDSAEVLKKSEALTSKVGMALTLLKSGISGQIEDLKHKQDMGLRIIEAQEAERKRVSRDIHDGPAQAMANAVLKADYCERVIDANPDGARTELRSLREEVRDSLRDIRKIIYDLMPMSLADLGLIPTLERLARDTESDLGIPVLLTVDADSTQPVDSLVELTVFRIMQESLTNIRKHARAKNVTVFLAIRNEEIEMKIQDDGIGFDPGKIRECRTAEGGYGLYSMQERVELLDGSIVLDAAPGKGSLIHVIIPLVDKEAEDAGAD